MQATRERKERFIKSFGDRAVRAAVETIIQRYGLGWLTDEQVHDITVDMASDALASTRQVIRNRRIYQRELGRPIVRGADVSAYQEASQ